MLERLTAALSARYRVERELGAGGMATVYLAHDRKHDRPVALKVLRPELAAVLGTERFLREVGIVAKLNHPHILPLYDSGEADGLLYYVMPLVVGDSLRTKLRREGRLAIGAAIAIVQDVASALDYAHGRGVIHRDVKPENILLHQGEAMVADFGIALPLHGPESERLTVTGLSIGTPHYMSPEQATGDPGVDHRTDVYALACVFFEMLAGAPPFTGANAQAVIAAHLGKSAANVTAMRPEVGRAVASAIAKGLAKNPTDRFDSASEFTRALLDQDLGPSPAPSIRSIAVLPLDNLSRDPAQEFFSDGMTDALITDLAKIGALKVISRTSVMRYKGTTKPLPEIALELNVDAIVGGSVLRVGDRVRITAQLIHAASDTHLWAESYDRALTNILGLQSDVARAIAGEVSAKLTPQEEARLTARPPVNAAAHEAYLKGRYFWNQRGQGLMKSVDFFQEALAHDSGYAPAHAGLADAYALLGFYGYLPPREAMPKAKEAARRAIALDDHLAEAHACLGYVHTMFDWEWENARKAFERAIELNPSWGPTHYWYAVWMHVTGRLEDAITEVRRGLELDPLSVYMQAQLGVHLIAAKRYSEASKRLLETLQLDPQFMVARSTLGMAYFFQGLVDDAIRELRRAVQVSNRDPWPVGFLGGVYAAMGDATAARAIVGELERRTKHEYIPSFYLASIYARLGEMNEAIRWLDKAYEERASLVVFSGTNTYPSWTFDRLRLDPRFQKLVQRLGLPSGS